MGLKIHRLLSVEVFTRVRYSTVFVRFCVATLPTFRIPVVTVCNVRIGLPKDPPTAIIAMLNVGLVGSCTLIMVGIGSSCLYVGVGFALSVVCGAVIDAAYRMV